MALLTDDQTANELLAVLEARPFTGTREEIAERTKSAAMGRELSRLQGFVGSPIAQRFHLLYARGQVSKDEAKDLLRRLARMGVLEARQDGMDGR